MTFDAWLIATDLSEPDFASEFGVARETVRRWRAGVRQPDFETQRRIFDRSGGQVTPNDWVGVGPRAEIQQVTT